MEIKLGKFGKFLACPGFPACRNAKPILNKTGAFCPTCGGDLVERRGGKAKRLFFGCANYPTCSFSSWSRPVPEPCPKCGGLQVEAGRDKLRCLSCEPEPEQRRANGTTRRAGADGARNGTTASAATVNGIAAAARREPRTTTRRVVKKTASTKRSKGEKVVSRSRTS